MCFLFSGSEMNVGDVFFVNCFAEPTPDGQWQAFTVQFGLAVQGESLHEVREKLDAMVHDYINEALNGEDRPYARQLLSRKAAPSIRAKYHWYKLLTLIHALKNKVVYEEPLRFSAC
jgi:hypothetical protein